MRIAIPPSLVLEHAELHDFLMVAENEPGAVGEAMRRVARLLEPHMRKEEAFAMPPLGLLARLARGECHADMLEVLAHTDWLRNNLQILLSEHHVIRAAAENFLAAARAEGRGDCLQFAEKLMHHLRLEEEVMYPAAVVLGEYLKLKLAEGERLA
jgi:iron-sulfur cluster repair protein YtfE (RIC family)